MPVNTLDRDVPAIEEALSLLYRSYAALGMTQLRDDTLRVMQKNYPNSPFTRRDVKAKEGSWFKFW